MEFNIGDKVKCINDSVKPGLEEFVYENYLNWVKKGEIYTIRSFVYNDGIVTGILLEEVHNYPIYIHLINREQEPAFAMFRFVKEDVNTISVSVSVENEIDELVKV